MTFQPETRLAFVALCFALLCAISACKEKSTTTNSSQELTVAAASDLMPAFQEIGREFESANKTKVVFVFGSTGLLTKQIENGAPMDVFAAANVSYIDQLDQKGLIIPDTKAIYGRGRITLWTSGDSNLRLEGIADLARPEVTRIAIANPDHAPYGLAARQALESATSIYPTASVTDRDGTVRITSSAGHVWAKSEASASWSMAPPFQFTTIALTSDAQPPQLLADGEVVMAYAFNGRIFSAAQEEGKPFQIIWDGQIYEMEGWVVPKGANNLEDALKFVAWTTSPAPQARAAA